VEQDKGRLLRRNTSSRRLNVTQRYRADLVVIFCDSLDCEPVPFCWRNLESKQTRGEHVIWLHEIAVEAESRRVRHESINANLTGRFHPSGEFAPMLHPQCSLAAG